MYIHMCVLIQGRNLMDQEIQRTKPFALMRLSWHHSQSATSAPLAQYFPGASLVILL